MAGTFSMHDDEQFCAPVHSVTLSDDIWLLIWQQLPPKGLLFASHVCRTWRINSLRTSSLWTHLTLYAYEPDTNLTMNTVNNISLLRHLLPRSKALPLSLDVDVSIHAPSDDFQDELSQFLELVAPRLVALRMCTADPTFAGRSFCINDLVFPALRVLDLSSSIPDTKPWLLCDVILIGERFPELVSLALHEDHRPQCVSTWFNLQSLTCTVNTILDIEPALLTAHGLQHLQCECVPDAMFDTDEGATLSWPNAPLLRAFSAIPDVHITTLFEPEDVELAFLFFASVPRPRLLLDFICGEYDGPLKLRDCAQLSSATRLSVYFHDICIFITAEDDSERVMRIALMDVHPGDEHPIDWALIPSLPALSQLCVDAALWKAVAHSFPHAPLLADVKLELREAGDIDALLGGGRIAHVPQGVSLTLTSESPISVARDKVAGLMVALGVTDVSMVGGIHQQ